MSRIYIDLPFNLYQKAKSFGVMYDTTERKCYILDEQLSAQFDLVTVDVPYGYSDIAKDNGAKFFKDNKQWKTSRFNVKNLENILNDDSIKKLKTQQLQMMSDPKFKLIAEIEKMENMRKKYNMN
jgi:hypothetical protein